MLSAWAGKQSRATCPLHLMSASWLPTGSLQSKEWGLEQNPSRPSTFQQLYTTPIRSAAAPTAYLYFLSG